MSIPKVNAVSQEFALGTKISGDGYFIIRFHPKLPILACGSISQVLLFSVPTGWFNTSFSNCKKTQIQLEQSQMPMEVIAMDWNMNGTQLAAGCSSGMVIVWDYPSGDILFEKESHLKPLTEINWNLFQTNILASLDCDRAQLLLWDSGASHWTNDVVNTCCTVVGCKESMFIAKHDETEDDNCEFEDKQEEQFDKINWISSEEIAICFDNSISEISDHDDSLKSRLLPFLEKGRSVITPRNNKNEAKHFSWFFDLVLLLALMLCSSLLLMASILSLLAFLVPLLVFLTLSAFFVFWALSACLTLALIFRPASIVKK